MRRRAPLPRFKELGLGLLVDNNRDFLQSKAKSNRKVFYVVDQWKLYPVTGIRHTNTNTLCESMTLVVSRKPFKLEQTKTAR